MPKKARVIQEWDPEDSPTAWLAVFERAVAHADMARAAEAQAELLRLGVRVNYHVLRRVLNRAHDREEAKRAKGVR